MAITEQQRESLQHRLSLAAGTLIDAQIQALGNNTHANQIADAFDKEVFAYCAIAEHAICQARYALERVDNGTSGLGLQIKAVAETLIS